MVILPPPGRDHVIFKLVTQRAELCLAHIFLIFKTKRLHARAYATPTVPNGIPEDENRTKETTGQNRTQKTMLVLPSKDP